MSSVAMNSPAPMANPARTRRDFEPRTRFGPAAIAVMVAFHAVVGYALATGLGKRAIEIVKKPLTATIVEELKLPPPPPPPPPPKVVRQEQPRVQAPPPPAYVPPPEVAPPPTPEPAPTITAVISPEPPPPPPPIAPPAPPAPPVPPRPVSSDIAIACPKQVPPEMPQKAIDESIGGTVRAEMRIRGGRVADVRIVSGPRLFHAAVRAAIAGYECIDAGDAGVVATQDFTFKVD